MTAYVPEDPIDFRMGQKTPQDKPRLDKGSKYTITCNYGQIGEGRTIAISYVVAASAPAALQVFAQSLIGGEWLAKAAHIVEEWDFLGEEAQLLVTPAVQHQLEEENCYQTFTATMYYNHS